MAFALVKKIKSVLRIPAVHAADDPEAEVGDSMPTETEAGAVETDAVETERRRNIKSLDELLSAEIAPETMPEPETPPESEPAPAEPDAPATMPEAEPAPAESDAPETPPEVEPAPAEPDAPEIPPEAEPAPPEDAASEAPVAPETPPEPEPAPPEPDALETMPETEIPPEAEPAPAESDAPETPPEPEPAPPEDAADEAPAVLETPPEAEPAPEPETPPEAEPAPAEPDAPFASGDASEPAPSGADKEQQKLHAKALRFANGRTGLLGLMRRLRDVALIGAALATKAFVRSKKRKAKDLIVSEDVERAFTGGDEKSSAADATATALATEREKDAPAQVKGDRKKPAGSPSVKKATIKKGAASDSDNASLEAPPLDKAAAKKAKEKERAAAKKAKDNEKKAAKKAKDEAKKTAKTAKEEAKKVAKEAKEAAFAEKYPKKAAKRAEKAAKKEAKKTVKDAKNAAKPDKAAVKAAKDVEKAAKKAKKEANKKPKLTKEEKFRLKLEKQAAKHEKKIERFERKARKIEQRLEKKHQKREVVQGKKNEKKAVSKERSRIRKERKREIKKQRKYWLKKGVGRAKRNASVISLVILIIAALTTSTAFLYKSDRVNIPILNGAVEAVIGSPVVTTAMKILDKPVRVAMEYAAIPVSFVIQLIQGVPKVEEVYFFEADKMERYEAFREANPDMPVDEVVWRVNVGVDLNLYQDPVRITDFNKKPILVNKFHSLPAEYEPRGMVQMPDNVLMRADPEAAAAFERLREAAASENLNITAASAYRSYEYQNLIYNPNVSDTREKQDNFLSRPGFSENQSGLAFDLSVNNGRMYDFAGTPEAVWTAENAEIFGFILRYPAGREDVTGVPYQPWHIRYVGDEVVKTMRENDIKTLEEYCVKFVDHKPGDTPEKPIEKESESSMSEGTDGPI